jgi:uncharacterized membrane protein
LNESIRDSKAMKAVSLLLIIGGVVGIIVALITEVRFLSIPGAPFFSPSVAIVGVFNLIYGWGIWTGVDLWRGKNQALLWARILFAMQILAITVPGFTYEFHTGFIIQVLFRGAEIHFGFNLGSSFAFYISQSIEGFALGINVFAVGVFVYLLGAGRPKPNNFGLIQGS